MSDKKYYEWSFNAVRIEQQHVDRHDRMAKFYWKLLDNECVRCPYRERYELAVSMRREARKRLKYALRVNETHGRDR